MPGQSLITTFTFTLPLLLNVSHEVGLMEETLWLVDELKSTDRKLSELLSQPSGLLHGVHLVMAKGGREITSLADT